MSMMSHRIGGPYHGNANKKPSRGDQHPEEKSLSERMARNYIAAGLLSRRTGAQAKKKVSWNGLGRKKSIDGDLGKKPTARGARHAQAGRVLK